MSHTKESWIYSCDDNAIYSNDRIILECIDEQDEKAVARWSYEMADAMLEARGNK